MTMTKEAQHRNLQVVTDILQGNWPGLPLFSWAPKSLIR